ncbi:MAG: hypothetical protein KGS72_00160 [Cyanobacteria bacterium REEB67]|nr:hypothetical protein [Cyanobacteria bacterium REEB67]
MTNEITAWHIALDNLETYRCWMLKRGVAALTVHRYCKHLKLFKNFLLMHPERYNFHCINAEIAAEVMTDFVLYCYLTSRLSMRVTDQMAQALRSFFAYLELAEISSDEFRLSRPGRKSFKRPKWQIGVNIVSFFMRSKLLSV